VKLSLLGKCLWQFRESGGMNGEMVGMLVQLVVCVAEFWLFVRGVYHY
jgi:hypothetical protein